MQARKRNRHEVATQGHSRSFILQSVVVISHVYRALS